MARAKVKAIFNSNIPVDKDGNSIETIAQQTERLLNGNKYGDNNKQGRYHAMKKEMKGIETLFGNNYELGDGKGDKLIALLLSTAERWQGKLDGVTAEDSSDC